VLPLAIATGVVGLALAGALAWFLGGTASGPPEPSAASPALDDLAFVAEAPDEEPELPEPSAPPRQRPRTPPSRAGAPPAPESASPLPDLDTSDAFVRALVGALSKRPELVVWLANEDLVRRFVAAVDNVAEGRSPRTHLAFLGPAGDFPVVGEGPTLHADPRGERRYTALAVTVASLDVEGSVRAYNRLEPLFEAAYVDLGHPEGGFGGRLTQAIAELLAVPFVSGSPGLTAHVFSYRYTDPELEELSEAQKHLLRMAPRNVRAVQSKLRELARSLGIASDALPRQRRYVALPAGS
jgi:hypothetical protein